MKVKISEKSFEQSQQRGGVSHCLPVSDTGMRSFRVAPDKRGCLQHHVLIWSLDGELEKIASS